MALKDLFNKISSQFKAEPTEPSEQGHPDEAKKMWGELGADKLKAVISEVTAAFPLFEKAGYRIEEVQVEIGVMPKLMPRFSLVKEIDIAEQEALLKEAEDKKLVKFMLISLFKSTKMKNLIQDPKLEFHAIEIDLTAVPSVRGIFKSIENTDNVVRLDTSDFH